MAKYFTLTTGLRGCYADGERVEVVMCRTRRELKAQIQWTADFYASDCMAGNTERCRASVAAAAWREAHKARPSYLPHCLPLKPDHADSYSHGVFVGTATRAEYLAYQAEDESNA